MNQISINTFTYGNDGKTTAIPVNGTGDSWTMPLPISAGVAFSLVLQAGGTGTKNVNVILEVGVELPAVNYNAADANFVTYENYSSPTITLNNTNKRIIAIFPVVAKYIRLKLDGQTGNDASTTVTALLNKIV